MANEALQSSSDPTFLGFDIPRQNWFKMPNTWTDITADITSLAELKVIEYVLKHTWGYREYGLTKRITTDEFMHGRRRKDGTRMDRGTGLSKPSVVAGLKSAVAHGYLEEIVDNTDLARIKKYYSLKMQPGVNPDDESIPEENPPPAPSEAPEIPGVKNLNSDVKNLNIRGKESLHRSEKDTLDRHQQTDTKNNNNTGGKTDAKDHVVVALLFKHGVAENVAYRLTQHYNQDRIEEKIAFLEFLLDERPEEVKKPAAWLRKAIEDNYSAPDGFVSKADRERRRQEEVQEKESRYELMQEAQQVQRAKRAAEAAERANYLQRIRDEYGTNNEDITFWEEAQWEIKFTTPAHIAELVADMEILKVKEDSVVISVERHDVWRQLQHPRTKKALQQAFARVAGQLLEVEVVLDKAQTEG
jgi:hypothetical protein